VSQFHRVGSVRRRLLRSAPRHHSAADELHQLLISIDALPEETSRLSGSTGACTALIPRARAAFPLLDHATRRDDRFPDRLGDEAGSFGHPDVSAALSDKFFRRCAGRRAGFTVSASIPFSIFRGSMKKAQSNVVETLRQMGTFADANVGILGPGIAASRRNVGDVVSQLTAYAVSQESGKIASRGATARQQVLRAALRMDHMRAIAGIARLKLRDVPEFHALVMPPKNASSAQLVASATAMADAAVLHEDVFKDVGMPDDFVSSLRSAAVEVAQSIDARKVHGSKRSGATAGLAAEERRGRSLIRLMDALITPRLKSNDALLAEWKSAKKVRRKPGPTATVVGGGATVAASA
jgi:hypothetical protein